MARTDPDDINLRAADYVLGLMEPKEAVFFERDMRRDPGLASRVDAWRRRAAGLDDSETGTPHERMRRLIEAGLGRGETKPSHDAVVREATNRRTRLLFAAAGAVLALIATLLWRFAAG